jgi:hypothetical protein
MCSSPVGKDPLELRHGRNQAVFCSFECMIQFGAERIRQRRLYHNGQFKELRRQLRAARKPSERPT